MIKNDNYICIQGFMVKDLELKGNELLVYAIIFGFSQTTGNRFTGGLQYLMDWTNASKQTIINVMKSLIAKNYIIKHIVVKNNVQFCEYECNLTSGQKIRPPQSKNLTTPSQKIRPNNITNNINNNIYNTTSINARPIKEKKLNNLQEFSNLVIEQFENEMTNDQKAIWFKRNCRCLSDILKFCDNDKELGIQAIRICAERLEKAGLKGGYEAVCRNLPEYYALAKKHLNYR